MVDLGFLLITFFVFTTSMMSPKALKLAMPDDSGNPTPVKCSESFSIVVQGDGKTRWYACKDGAPADLGEGTLSDPSGLRQAIIGKLHAMAASGHEPRDLVVLIKPLEDANYQAVVEALDEMIINGVTRYAIVDPDDADR
jgi:biopolymer transport protein ExbD